jgi:hypothetical protein
MTLHAEPPPITATQWEPGTYVYDEEADAVGRVADPRAYPPHYIGNAAALVVPLSGDGRAWQAISGCLRLATDAEIEKAQR